MKKPSLKSQAVISVDKGEAIEGMWATPQIPEIGVYKLAAKKRADGVYEWVHFQHRPDGTRKVLFRGEVESKSALPLYLSRRTSSFKTSSAFLCRLRISA
jgi:hypothetical protein